MLPPNLSTERSRALNELRVYDPNRRPAEWTDLVRPGQLAVFLSDVRSGGAVQRDGRSSAKLPATCFVVDSLEEAKSFCNEQVARVPTMRCDVYDHRGKATEALLSVVNPRHARRLPSRQKIRTMMIVGIAMLLPSPLLFWWDYRHRLGLVWPTLLAINLLVFGLRIVHWGYMELERMRSREHAEAAVSEAEEKQCSAM